LASISLEATCPAPILHYLIERSANQNGIFMTTSYYAKLLHRPKQLRDGDELYLPRDWIEKYHEFAVTFGLICNRQLFGSCYRELMPKTYEVLGRRGGVMIGYFIKSTHLIPEMTFPGDIDLLVIPYNDDRLLISETLAIEIKIVRARFSKQGKAPNEFGFSQAEGAISHGFPYSAVAHLIVSDKSPSENWETLLSARVADSVTGRLDNLKEIKIDAMPLNLIHRSFGRLRANRTHDSLGLLAAYISMESGGHWTPTGEPALKNKKTSHVALQSITDYYELNYRQFIDTPKY